MNPACFSAPGKLMVFGEYAVLEGHPAVALCFDRRIRCTATAGGGGLRFDAPSLLGDRGPLLIPELGSVAPDPALRLLWPLLREAVPALGGLTLRFEAGFPHFWGLGSSSASSLAAVAATWTLLGRPVARSELFAAVRGLQRAHQGAASGYDAATQLLGGVVRFVGGDAPVFERIPVPVTLGWVVAWTGVKASTGAMIRDARARYPLGDPLYARIGDLAREGEACLRTGDVVALGAAMNEGHSLLSELGAVPDDLEGLILALQGDPCVHGARLAGAGGGDCVLILAEDPEGAAQAARAHGFDVLPVRFEEQGLRAELVEES